MVISVEFHEPGLYFAIKFLNWLLEEANDMTIFFEIVEVLVFLIKNVAENLGLRLLVASCTGELGLVS